MVLGWVLALVGALASVWTVGAASLLHFQDELLEFVGTEEAVPIGVELFDHALSHFRWVFSLSFFLFFAVGLLLLFPLVETFLPCLLPFLLCRFDLFEVDDSVLIGVEAFEHGFRGGWFAVALGSGGRGLLREEASGEGG